MSLNSGESNTAGSTWNQDQAQQEQAKQNQHFGSGALTAGLQGLFSMPSMSADNRSVKEVGETRDELAKFYENVKKSTTNDLQRKIIPTIEVLTSSVSPQLPGLGLYATIGDTMYIAAAVFYNRNMSIGSERVNINMGNNTAQSMSIPRTPAQYTEGPFIGKLKEHFTRFAESKSVKNVSIINVILVDLELLAHPEAGEPKDYPQHIASWVATEWEEAILVKVATEMTQAGQPIPSPFITKDTPYGKENCAEARVNAISGRVNKAKHLLAANIEVIVSTMSNPSNPAAFQVDSREVARATGTVSLAGVTWEEHCRVVNAQQMNNNQQNIMQLMGVGMSNYPMNYRPLRPIITVDTAQPGELMGNNGGLHSYFFSLYAMLATNNHYVFMEGLRKNSVGARGNLSALEVRIEHLLKAVPNVNLGQRIKLDDKNINDTDLVNQWVRQNVSGQAMFQVVLNNAGCNASIHNFLRRLADVNNNALEMKTLVNVLDSLSNNRFSQLLVENKQANTGWNTTKPALIPTQTIGINGLATLGDRKLNPLEIDEMMISHLKGKNVANIESMLQIIYGGNTNESLKQRTQKLRLEGSQSIFDGALHINNFTLTAVWHPELLAVIGKAMDGIGQLHVANNLGSWKSNSQVFQPGLSLATSATAGNNGGLALNGFGFTAFG